MSETTDYAQIAAHCEQQAAVSRSVIDDFLVYYAAAKGGYDREFDQRLKPYSRAIGAADPAVIARMKAQFVLHRVFKAGGPITRYLRNSEIRMRPAAEQAYLHLQAQQPWRMCFSVVTGRPSANFFQMQDVLTGEPFLLYSKGTQESLVKDSFRLWFNLIAFNGRCWQTYGPIIGYRSFDLDDIFYFATELNPRIESEEELFADLERNPVPYMLLYLGAHYPLTVHRKQVIASTGAEYEWPLFESSLLKKDFRIEYDQGVYRATLKKERDTLEYPVVYYDERRRVLFVHAMTERAFAALVRRLNKAGLKISPEPQFSVKVSMLTTLGDMLNRKVTVSPYDHLFQKPARPQAKAGLDRLNAALQRALPEINAGKMPDVAALAKETGLDEKTLTKIFRNTLAKLDKLGPKK